MYNYFVLNRKLPHNNCSTLGRAIADIHIDTLASLLTCVEVHVKVIFLYEIIIVYYFTHLQLLLMYTYPLVFMDYAKVCI